MGLVKAREVDAVKGPSGFNEVIADLSLGKTGEGAGNEGCCEGREFLHVGLVVVVGLQLVLCMTLSGYGNPKKTAKSLLLRSLGRKQSKYLQKRVV